MSPESDEIEEVVVPKKKRGRNVSPKKADLDETDDVEEVESKVSKKRRRTSRRYSSEALEVEIAEAPASRKGRGKEVVSSMAGILEGEISRLDGAIDELRAHIDIYEGMRQDAKRRLRKLVKDS